MQSLPALITLLPFSNCNAFASPRANRTIFLGGLQHWMNVRNFLTAQDWETLQTTKIRCNLPTQSLCLINFASGKIINAINIRLCHRLGLHAYFVRCNIPWGLILPDSTCSSSDAACINGRTAFGDHHMVYSPYYGVYHHMSILTCTSYVQKNDTHQVLGKRLLFHVEVSNIQFLSRLVALDKI